jgi:hypothetical protein
MGTIFMDIDAFYVFAIHIATQVRALVYDKACLASLLGKIGESGSIKA